MECPYCHGELAPGTLNRSARDYSYWLPQGIRVAFRTKKRVKQAGGLVADTNLEAWYCRTCKRMTIFDVK